MLLAYSDVLVAMQDSEAGLVLQQCQIQNKDYNNCFTGLCHCHNFLYYVTFTCLSCMILLTHALYLNA